MAKHGEFMIWICEKDDPTEVAAMYGMNLPLMD
jgi:hypothetical protein